MLWINKCFFWEKISHKLLYTYTTRLELVSLKEITLFSTQNMLFPPYQAVYSKIVTWKAIFHSVRKNFGNIQSVKSMSFDPVGCIFSGGNLGVIQMSSLLIRAAAIIHTEKEREPCLAHRLLLQLPFHHKCNLPQYNLLMSAHVTSLNKTF